LQNFDHRCVLTWPGGLSTIAKDFQTSTATFSKERACTLEMYRNQRKQVPSFFRSTEATSTAPLAISDSIF
jgi:hypothetical protein